MGQAKELVDRAWQAIESHALDKLSELYTPDAEITHPGGIRFRGPEQLRPFLEAYLTAFPDLRHEGVDWVESGDTIAVELRTTGTHTGPLHTPDGAIPPTGKQFLWESVDFIKVEGGKIASWHVYLDQVPFLTQLGLIPAPASA
jgi:ketosteroid isomerase-like protein